jgi:hypothetical protein
VTLPGVSRPRACVLGLVVAVLVCLPAAAADGPASAPLLGANYLHYEDVPPNCSGLGIVSQYDRPGIRALVRSQLAAMRAAGMRSTRLVLYHSTAGDSWNVLPSAGGTLPEPYRTNLVRYVGDVRAAGFTSLTVAFNPWASNDPIGYTTTPYDPAKLDENSAFIGDVHDLVKANGPPTTRFDLINEGAPHDWQPGLRAYVVELWKRSVAAFGAGDATISVIVNPTAYPRLPNLVDALLAAGQPLPTWFDVHPSWSSVALDDLRRVDAFLASRGLSQPLVVGEEAYDNAEAAAAIAAFMRESPRRVLEVMEWPLSTPGTSWQTCPTAPYRIAAYARALTPIVPYRLAAAVSPSGTTLVAAGIRPAALGSGSYEVVVRDTSPRDGFRLVSRGFGRRTGASFRGTVKWRVRLYEYDTLRYGRLRGPLRSIPVLGGGGR